MFPMADALNQTIEEQPKPTSLAEYKAAKSEPPPVKPVPATEPKQPPTETQPVVASETAAPSGSAEPTPQKEQPKPGTLEDRIKQLRAQGKHHQANDLMVQAATKEHREESERLKRELAELRTRSNAPASQPEAPKAQPQAEADPKPKLADYLKKPENLNKEYDEVVELFLEDRDAWTDRARERKSASESRSRTINEKITEGRGKHPDFDKALTVQLASSNLTALVNEIDNGMDVLYHLHENPDVHARIFNLSPARQLGELYLLSRELAAPANAAPEKPATPPPVPVSRIGAPPRKLSAVAPSEPGKPQTFADYKARNKTA